ncbi:hypothetical protein AK830_g625 [Neonectria ditissima]|uniref:Glycosyltransferase 2-like domain-containing protein n=1 Tax=Neonectria ditissima TaxID=78410 RepID=A0A0P7C1L6_9HYPO|nr:hypothetical protein AK830_g625 [Neonectria ditissima]
MVTMASFPWHIVGFIAFFILFFVRFFRLMTFYCAATVRWEKPVFRYPAIDHSHCSVVVPVGDLDSPHLKGCIRSILRNNVVALFLVTVGTQRRNRLHDLVSGFIDEYPSIEIHVGAVPTANKRSQIAHALPHVTTPITILADDNVTWPDGFVANATTPFGSPNIGAVGVARTIRKEVVMSFWHSFWKFLDNVYYDTLNTQALRANAFVCLDSGINSQTSLYRTDIIQDAEFLEAFQNESSFFGRLGPIVDGYEHFISRWLAQNNWYVDVQEGEPIEVPPSTALQVIQNCERQHRNSLHSNAAVIRLREVWRFNNMLTAFTKVGDLLNFALVFDASMALALAAIVSWRYWAWAFAVIGIVEFLANIIHKPAQALLRNPLGCIHIFGHILFEYFQDFLKLKAIFTLYKLKQSSRRSADLEEGVDKRIEWIWGTYGEVLRIVSIHE